jgi:transposase
MSTSEHYHIQGAVGFDQIGGVTYEGHNVIYRLVLKEERIKCPKCGNTHVHKRGTVVRTLRAVPVGHRKDIFYHVTIPRVHCAECGIIRQVDISWFALPYKSYTNGLAKEVLERIKSTPISKVAEALDIDWHTANTILQTHLAHHYSHIDFKGVHRIAIDEIAISKGHHYFTIVQNLDTGNPIYVGEGKGEDALSGFWELLGRRWRDIYVVALDMSPAYTKAVIENLPNSQIVYDRFHVHKLANEAINKLRCSIFSSATREEQAVIKGSKFLLLKNEDNLDETRNERERLERVLSLNTPLTTGYVLKKSLRQIWMKGDFEEALQSLTGWVKSAASTGINILVSLGKTIERHSEGILNYYNHRVTSGPIEGLNNKIKALKRRAYGFRNLLHFKRLILGINEFDPRTLLST